MTSETVFAFACTKCGQCCKHGGPALSIEEIFKYQDTFITGLRYGTYVVPKKFIVMFKDELVDAQKMRSHIASFTASSFDDNKGDNTIQPHIYPLATGYAINSPCPALHSDGTTCILHEDKPAMCRSVPFDPAFPEHMQGIQLRRFGHDCMTTTDAPDAPNVIYRNGKITDTACKDDYDRRLAAMRKDQATLRILFYFIGKEPSHFGPSMAELMSTADGGWIETSTMPLLYVLLKNKDITPQIAENFLRAQIALSEAGTDGAGSQRREHGRAATMREYLGVYRKLLDDTGKLASGLLDAYHEHDDKWHRATA